MESILKKVRIIAILLISIFIIAMGFCGIYAQVKGIWENVLPKYNLGMELSGYKEYTFELDTNEETKDVYVDENGNYKGTVENANTSEASVQGQYKIESRTIKANEPSQITIENFEKVKDTIKKRLERNGINEYNIRLDNVTGKMLLEVPNEERNDIEISIVTTIGKLEFVDQETGVVVLDDANLIAASPYSRTEETGEYGVYLQLEFEESVKEKLAELTRTYTESVSGTGDKKIKYIEVRIDGVPFIETYFQKEITSGIVHVPVGDLTTDHEEYHLLLDSVTEISNLINEENIPLQYVANSEIIVGPNSILEEYGNIIKIAILLIFVAISIYMIVRFKFEGLRQAIFALTYIALITIIFRYAKVIITVNSLIALAGCIIINYVFSIKFLKKLQKLENRKMALKETLKEIYLSIVPVCIIAVIFTFMIETVISSVGMTLFWGLLIQVILSLLTLL